MLIFFSTPADKNLKKFRFLSVNRYVLYNSMCILHLIARTYSFAFSYIAYCVLYGFCHEDEKKKQLTAVILYARVHKSVRYTYVYVYTTAHRFPFRFNEKMLCAVYYVMYREKKIVKQPLKYRFPSINVNGKFGSDAISLF